jgi:hypothetical protein
MERSAPGGTTMKPKTALYYALNGDLVHDPTVESHYGSKSHQRMIELRKQLEIAIALSRKMEPANEHL